MITVPLKLYIQVRKSMICYLDRSQERTLERKDDKSRKIETKYRSVQLRTKHSSTRLSVIA